MPVQVEKGEMRLPTVARFVDYNVLFGLPETLRTSVKLGKVLEPTCIDLCKAASVTIDLFAIYSSGTCRQRHLGPCASIAQGLEHWSCKPGVVSSNLTGGCVCKFSVALVIRASPESGHEDTGKCLTCCTHSRKREPHPSIKRPQDTQDKTYTKLHQATVSY